MYIDHTHTGAMLRNLAAIRQNIFQNFFPHAHAIVFDNDQDVLVLLYSGDDDHAAIILIHVTDTIINGIFQDGLNHQLNDAVVFDLFINPEVCFEPLFLSGPLDVHIASAMLQFILDGNDGLAPGQADTK